MLLNKAVCRDCFLAFWKHHVKYKRSEELFDEKWEEGGFGKMCVMQFVMEKEGLPDFCEYELEQLVHLKENL